MRKIILLTLLACTVSISFAKKVKFSVDMRYQTVSLLGVHVMGDFQDEAGFPGDWESGTTEMINEAGTSIYSVVVDIPADKKYEYRFVNGDQTYEAEFVPQASRVGYDFIDNRWLYVHNSTADTFKLSPILFGGNAPFGKKLLRVYVDAANMQVSSDGMYVAGNFQNWNANSDKLYNFVGKVYELIVYADSASTVEYKYYNGSTVEIVPTTCATNGNRTVVLNSDSALSTVCFSACTDCAIAGISINNKQHYLSLYPNPVANELHLKFENTLAKNISIVNTQGQEITSIQKYTEQELLLNNLNLAKGIYLVRVIDTNGSSSVKFVVE